MSKISVKNIAEAIERETEGKSGAELLAVLKNTVEFLHKKRMLSQSEAILSAFEKKINEKNGIVKIKVRSAKEIPENKKKTLEKEIKEKYGAKEIESVYLQDLKLLGGMKIEIGDEVLDDTYRNRLNQLEKVLIQK